MAQVAQKQRLFAGAQSNASFRLVELVGGLGTGRSFAFGKLDVYGKNSSFRSDKCRGCSYKDSCKFFWDITNDQQLVQLYVDNEKYDGYLRDGCVFREDIDIFDQMAVQIKYASKVQVSYSLTAFSPYEGYRIAFNGTKGRLEAWIKENQPWQESAYDEIQLTHSFGQREIIQVANNEGGHGGGDARLRKQILNPMDRDPYRQAAGSRDGAMALPHWHSSTQQYRQRKTCDDRRSNHLKTKSRKTLRTINF